MADILAVAVGVVTFGGLVWLYLSYSAAWERVNAKRTAAETRPRLGGCGRYVGGHDRPGEN